MPLAFTQEDFLVYHFDYFCTFVSCDQFAQMTPKEIRNSIYVEIWTENDKHKM